MAQQVGADQALIALFNQYNLGGLAKQLVGFAQQGLGQDEAYLKLRETKEYQARFQGNFDRQKKFPKLSLLSEAEYISKEQSIEEDMRFYGLPKGFYDQPEDYAKLIASNVGREELRKRLDARKAVVTDGKNTGVLAYAKAKYGLSDGDLIAYFIDPERAAPLLERIAAASSIGAAGARSGFGAVSRTDAERLANLGISGAQAAQGYGEAAALGGLTQNIAGTDSGTLSREELAAAALEDSSEARRKIKRRQEERAARFSGGGSYSESQSGVRGLGSANTR